MDSVKRKIIHKGFKLGVLFKFMDGVLELAGGVLLLLVRPGMIRGLVLLITQHELSEDPRDLVANFLVRAAAHLSVSTQFFGFLYLLSHGIIKLVLAVSLWKAKLWSYPAAIAFFLAFILYQLYRYSYTHSIWLIFLSVLDLVFVILAWLEYMELKRELRQG